MIFDDKYPEVARPYLASFVIVRRGNKIAMVLRANTGYMDGFYGLPAGKVEWDETFTQAAQREAKEEAGVETSLEDLQVVHTVHRRASDQAMQKFQDWIDVYFVAKKWSGEPYNAEEHKSERLDWLSLDNLPDNVVPPVREALQRISKN